MFHVGQMVVCVDDSPSRFRIFGRDWVVQDLLLKGNIYTIRGVDTFPFNTGPSLGLWLEEVVRETAHAPDGPFGAARFRPVRQTSIEQFTSILNQAPQRENA